MKLRDINEIVKGIKPLSKGGQNTYMISLPNGNYNLRRNKKGWRLFGVFDFLVCEKYFQYKREALEFVAAKHNLPKLPTANRHYTFGKIVPHAPFKLRRHNKEWAIVSKSLFKNSIEEQFDDQKFPTQKDAIEAAFFYSLSQLSKDNSDLHNWIIEKD